MKNQRKQQSEKIKYISIILITLFGGLLRFYDLDLRPLFVDEALFGLWVRLEIPNQEWLPIILTRLSQTELRFLFALSGTMTIPAIYFVVKNYKLQSAIIVALFPLFIFWSRMARPYAMAGLFIVLGWRWAWFYVPALLTTPVAVAGVRIIRQKWFIPVIAFITAYILFEIRIDTERFTENAAGIDMMKYSSRFWYIPALALLLYFFEYAKKIPVNILIGAFSILLYISITHIPNIFTDKDMAWYRREVRFSDWRHIPKVDYSTNVAPSWYYSGYKPESLRQAEQKEFYSRLAKGDTLTVGIDYLAFSMSRAYFDNNYTYWKVEEDYYPIQTLMNHHLRDLLYDEKVIVKKFYAVKNQVIVE